MFKRLIDLGVPAPCMICGKECLTHKQVSRCVMLDIAGEDVVDVIQVSPSIPRKDVTPEIRPYQCAGVAISEVCVVPDMIGVEGRRVSVIKIELPASSRTHSPDQRFWCSLHFLIVLHTM